MNEEDFEEAGEISEKEFRGAVSNSLIVDNDTLYYKENNPRSINILRKDLEARVKKLEDKVKVQTAMLETLLKQKNFQRSIRG